MLASITDDSVIDGLLAREAEQWWFERKYDGYRVVAIATDGKVKLRTRNGIDATQAYPEIVAALEDQPYDNFAVDGEVVVLDDEGNTSFERLQREGGLRGGRSERSEGVQLRYIMFDLLVLDAVDVRNIALSRRRNLLIDAFDFHEPLVLSELIEGDARELLTAACAAGWEGLIAKRIDSVYKPGRSRNWYKLKCLMTEEMVIVGFTAGGGSRTGFGALILGAFEGRQLVYTGKVGTGFDAATLRSLRQRLDDMVVDTYPFVAAPPGLGVVTWVKPELVCEVAFTEWTSSGQLRHPRYRGLRPDKEAAEVLRQRPVVSVGITNPDKIFFPAIDGTKAEVVEYYTMIADRMLTEVANRPLVFERFPNGISSKSFYQKNAPDHMPDYIGRLPVGSKSQGLITYAVVQDAAGLRYLANQAALVMHTLLSSADDPAHPIEVIWDLDPEGDDVPRVQKAAALLRTALDDLGLAPRVKSSGSKGMHIHVDITDDPGVVSYAMSRAFAQRVAWDLVDRFPADFTLEFAKKERRGRLLIDVLRNGHASHAAAPYSLRAVSEASLAAPLFWDEALDASFHPRMITMRNVAQRLDEGTDPWAGRPAPTSTIADAAAKLLG